MLQMKILRHALALLVGAGSTIFGNGGAWQSGVAGTGNASAAKNNRNTDVTIEIETLKIDLHPELHGRDCPVHSHNTGPKVQQDFSVRWTNGKKSGEADTDKEMNPWRATAGQ